MSIPNFIYPFDPTGTALTNRIVAERQVISPPNWTEFYFIVPLVAPYFSDSLQIIHRPSGRVLVEGVDYVCTHRFHDASLACAKGIYGSITFYDKTLTGTVELTYQTIGGVWVANDGEILAILANRLLNPRITLWEQVVSLPYQFPPIDHEWNLVDLVGASELRAKLEDIRLAIEQGGATGLNAHMADHDNPHEVNKTHVGLSNVQNYAIATTIEAQAGASNIRYMTPLRTREAITQLVGSAFTSHASNQLNPHNVTAGQLGLGNVQNFGIATVQQAQIGDATTVYMTPALTKAAINAQVTTSISDHVANVNNPHNTTKTHVGLGLVQNFDLATTLEARAGMATNKYMTPALVREAITSQVVNTINDHANNTNNPHLTTAAHVGLGAVQNYPIASSIEAEVGLVNDRYMTPFRVAEAIQARIGVPFDAHISDANNPHLVNKEQIGLALVQNYAVASEAQARAGVSVNTYMTPALTFAAIESYDTSNARSKLSFEDRTADLGDTWTPFAQWIHPTHGELDIDGFSAGIFMSNGPYDMSRYRIDADRRGNVNIDLEDGNVGFMVFEKQTEEIENGNSKTTLYLRMPANRQEVTITISYDPAHRLTDQLPVLAIPPESVVRIPIRKRVDGLFPTTPRGSIFFNDIDVSPPGQEEDTDANYTPIWQSGALVNYANVVTDENDRAAAEAHAMTAQYYANFDPWAFRDSRMNPAGTFTIADSVDYVMKSSSSQDNAAHLQTFISPFALTNYTFEVEISSTSYEANAIGVCAAAIEYNGRMIGIYALRTPGGLVISSQDDELAGGNVYQLFTVGLNLLHYGATMLAAGNGGLTWGDGVADEDRDTAGVYVAAGHGWDVAGTVRIRVTRSDNTLMIETTDFDSVTYVNERQVILDLNSPTTDMFVDRPSRIGFASFAQSDATYKILTAPHHYRPYVEVIPGENIDQDVVHYYTGTGWSTMEPTSIESPIRPGRLYVSQLSGNEGLYSAQRNHYLTKIASLN